jgi:hypothetical protein
VVFPENAAPRTNKDFGRLPKGENLNYKEGEREEREKEGRVTREFTR